MHRREYKSERIRRELTTARLARHDLDDKDDLSRAAYFCELVGNYTAQNALLNRGAEILPREKASNIGINSQGGELVPPLVADRVIELRQAAGVMRKYATTWPIVRGDEMSVPRRTTGVTVGFINEGATLTADDLAFDAVTLVPKKAGGMVRLSQEVSATLPCRGPSI